MLRISGNPKRTCAGTSRRELLIAGSLNSLAAATTANSAMAITPSAALTSETSESAESGTIAPGFGRAKSVICLFLFGGWSQLETFDMKPGAPAEIRGPYKPISSSLPGISVCEHLPQLSQRMDRLALIRSVNSPDANHNTCMILTGHDGTVSGTATKGFNPGIPRDRPYFLSAIQHLKERDYRHSEHQHLPGNMCVPNRLGLLEGYYRTGPYGGFLGNRFDPVCTQFGSNGQLLYQPGGVNPETLSLIPDGASPVSDVNLDRLDQRRSLLQQLDRERQRLLKAASVESYQFRERQVLDLLTSDRVRTALDLSMEPRQLRDRYGWNLFGQSVLLSRRLVEQGVPLVTAIWDCTKEGSDIAGLGWDTHWDHFKACEGWLLPGIDAAISALLDDLESRGMMDDTLVVVLSEMGRTPKINSRAGRDHWVGSYCALMAGAGIRPGVVHGETDAIASAVTDAPVSPQDLLATVYHLTGLTPETLIHDRQNRPSLLYGDGRPVQNILI
ncbi:MAG: DUF1501 domain-containing protein [Planctomyces sp.]